MRKKYLSALLFGALLVTSAGTFTSCKDYDDEINGLQEQVDKIIKDLETLQSAAGKYVTSVKYDAATGQLTVTGGNGESFQLPMPAELPTYSLEVKDGKVILKENGSVISEAQLPTGPEVPEAFNPELLKWKDGYLYYGDTKIEGVKEPVFDASITEIKDGSEILGYIIEIGEDSAIFFVKSELKSLVFIPDFYLDGIEAMESMYIPYNAIKGTKGQSTATYKTIEYTISEAENYRTDKQTEVTYINPTSFANYQMNPSSARVEDFKEGLSIISDDKQFINFSTSRAAEANPADAKYVEDVNGDLKVSFKVKGQYVAAQAPVLDVWGESLLLPADAEYANEKDYVTQMALQANLKTADKDTIITSDYSAVYASQIRPENIAYPKTSYAKDAFYDGYVPTSDHNEPSVAPGQGYHLYTKVTDAVANDPTVKVAYNGSIDLSQLTCLHFRSNSKTKFGKEGELQTFTAEELGKYNLKFKYELVDYVGGKNATSESKNCQLKANTTAGSIYNGEKTILDPCGVYGHESDENLGEILGEPSGVDGIETVGRMPLVRVTLMDTENNKIVEVGYIRLIIVESVDPVTTIVFDKGDWYYQGCNDNNIILHWAETQTDILGAAAVSSKEAFDKLYQLDLENNVARQFVEQGGKFTEITTAGSETATMPFVVGEITEQIDATAPTTTCLNWLVTEEDYKNLRRFATVDHNSKTIKYTYKVYVRYVGKYDSDQTPGISTRKPIYVPIQIVLNYPYAILDNKNANYWYAKESKTAGFEAVHFNVEVPGVTGHACNFVKDINAVFAMNETLGQKVEYFTTATVKNTTSPSFGVDSKFTEFQDKKLSYVYYFAAENNGKKVYGHANDIEGKNPAEYTLSVKYTTVREDEYKYVAGDYDKYSSADQIEEYDNAVLYATKGSVTKEVATIDQETGKVTYARNDFAKDILNHDYHKNLKVGETFRAEIGVAAFNSCAQLFPIADNEFDALFLRPVNIEKNEPKEFHDAADGGTAYTEQYILDIVKLSDWRDYKFSDNLNYFNYYGVESINIDEANIYTNMNQSSSDKFVKLSTVTDKIRFDHVDALPGVPVATATLADLKEHYGKLVYINNEANVHAFDIKVPVEITYKWGKYTIWVEIPVNKTINQ